MNSQFRIVLTSLFIAMACSAAAAQNPNSSSSGPLDAATKNYLKLQATPHEATRDLLLQRFKDLRAAREYMQAASILDEIRKESDFTPADPHLMDGGRQEPGKIGSLGKVHVIDAVNDDTAVVVTTHEGRRHLVVVRGLDGFTMICNDCPLDLRSVRIKGNEKYDLVLKERRALRQGTRREKVKRSTEEESERESHDEATVGGNKRSGEVEQDEDVTVSKRERNQTKTKEKKTDDETREVESSEAEKLLAPTRTVLVVEPINLTDTAPEVKKHWEAYRANEKKATDAVASEFYGEMVSLSIAVKDGECRVKAKNTTDYMMGKVMVELSSKPAGKIKPLNLAMSDIRPGRERTKGEKWRLRDAEPKVRIVSLQVLPPPPCSDCQDKRIRICPNCMGRLSTTCQPCKGSGKRIEQGTKEYSSGATKGRTEKLVDCNKCEAGQIKCKVCKLKGEVPCRKCQKKS